MTDSTIACWRCNARVTSLDYRRVSAESFTHDNIIMNRAIYLIELTGAGLGQNECCVALCVYGLCLSLACLCYDRLYDGVGLIHYLFTIHILPFTFSLFNSLSRGACLDQGAGLLQKRYPRGTVHVFVHFSRDEMPLTSLSALSSKAENASSVRQQWPSRCSHAVDLARANERSTQFRCSGRAIL